MIGDNQGFEGGPVVLGFDGPQIERRAGWGDFALQRHLNGDRPLLKIGEGEAGEEGVGREPVGVNHTPLRMAEAALHGGEDGVAFGGVAGGHGVGVVAVPDLRLRGIGDDPAVRGLENGGAEAAMPAVGRRDAARQRLFAGVHAGSPPIRCASATRSSSRRSSRKPAPSAGRTVSGASRAQSSVR